MGHRRMWLKPETLYFMWLKNGAQSGVTETRDFIFYVIEERGTEWCDWNQTLYILCDWRTGHRGVWLKPETLYSMWMKNGAQRGVTETRDYILCDWRTGHGGMWLKPETLYFMWLKNGTQRGVTETRDFIFYVTEKRDTEGCDWNRRLYFMWLKNGAQRGVTETRDFVFYVTEKRGTEWCDWNQRLYILCDWRTGHRGMWLKPETLYSMWMKNGAQRDVTETREFIDYVPEERGTEGCDWNQRIYRLCDWRTGHRGVWLKPENL